MEQVKNRRPDSSQDGWRTAVECVSGTAAVAIITAICYHFDLRHATPILGYLTIIVLLSLRGSFLSSTIVSLVAVGFLDFFIARPVFSLRVEDPVDAVATIAFLTTSAVITRLVARVRALMQEKLHRSESYLAEAQQLSHTGSFGWTIPVGDILWSDETFRIFEYDSATKPSLELVYQRTHPDDLVNVQRTFQRAAQDGNDFELQHRLWMPDGSVKYIQIVAHARATKAALFEFVGAVMDVTARTRAEEELRQAQAKLVQATRLTTMGELTATIAHEVNQPLTAVVANANAGLRWLNRPQPDLEEVRQALQRIAQDGSRGGDIIARIRALLKKEEPIKTATNLNDLIGETLGLLRVDLQGLSLQTELAPDLPPIVADRVQLQQLLLNLTVNAIEAMKPVTGQPRMLRVQSMRQNGSVVVTVQDSGVGLNAEKKEKLFESFYTTKPGGLGMGLSICRSVVENHGGRLWAEANNGPGAKFQFSLPIDTSTTQ